MKIEGSSVVVHSRDRVYAMLLDPAVLHRAIPGCEEIVPDGDGKFRVRMSAGLASIRGRVDGEIRVEEAEPTHHYKLSMKGKGMGSFMDGWASIDLSDAGGGGTNIAYNGEANVGGMIAAVGSRMIDIAVKKALGDFFDRLRQEAD